MMSDLISVRAQILDALLEKHLARKLAWTPRSDEDSFETTIGDYTYHLDRRMVSSRVTYKLWVFDQLGNDIDSFFAMQLENVTPVNGDFLTYWALCDYIYSRVKEKATVDRLAPAIEQLKNH